MLGQQGHRGKGRNKRGVRRYPRKDAAEGMSRNSLGWQNTTGSIKKMKEMRFKRQFYNSVFLNHLLTGKNLRV